LVGINWTLEENLGCRKKTWRCRKQAPQVWQKKMKVVQVWL